MVEINVPGFAHGELLGRGGFGSVYRAADERHGREVAIKILDGSLGDDERRRFDRERSAMGSLGGHPNIVPVFDSGYTEDGRAYIVMELAPSGSLRSQLDADGSMDWERATETMAAVARGVAAAHAADILHRDIKPDNILIDAWGSPKLADFGIATVVSGATTTKGASTTLAHAAPELLEGHAAAASMDVYALGSTLHNLISGMPPFARPGDELAAPMLRRILADDPPDLRPLGVPDAVARVVEQALAKDPEARQASASDFADQLESARLSPTVGLAADSGPAEVSAAAAHVTAASPPPIAAPDHDVAPDVVVETDASSPQSPRRRVGLMVAIAAIAALIIGGVAVASGGDGDEPVTEVAGPAATTPTTANGADADLVAEPSVTIDCPSTFELGSSVVCSIESLGAVEGSWQIPGFTDGPVVLDTVPGSNPIFIEPTDANYVGTTFTLTATVDGEDGTSVEATHSFTVVEDDSQEVAAPTTAAPTTAAPTTAAPTTAAPTTAAPTTAAPTTAAPTTAAPTTAPPTTAAPTTAAPAPSVSISCPSSIALNTNVICNIESANASSGSWSLPGFVGSVLLETVPGSNPIFINPTNADVVGQTFTISATVQGADGQTASTSRSFTVSG